MSQPNWKRTFYLALFLFVMGTVSYWFEYRYQPDREHRKETAERFFQIDKKELESILLTKDQKKISIHCAQEKCVPGSSALWQLREPMKTQADLAHVEALITSFDGMKPTETIDLSQETAEKRQSLLKDYGLDEVSRKTVDRVDMTLATGKTTSLYLGIPHPLGGSYFALQSTSERLGSEVIHDQRVYLIPQYVQNYLKNPINYWRNKVVFDFKPQEVESFRWEDQGSKKSVRLEKKEGKWFLHAGYPVMADQQKVQSFLNALLAVSAKEFVYEDFQTQEAQKSLKGADSLVRLELKLAASEKETSQKVSASLFKKSVNKEFHHFLTYSQAKPLFEVEATAVGRLVKKPKDFRITQLINQAQKMAAHKMTFSGKAFGDKSLVVVQKEGVWKSDQLDLDAEKVKNLLEKMTGNRIIDYLDSWDAREEKNALRWVLEDGTKKQEFIFWKKADQLYGRDLGSGRKEAFTVDRLIQNALPWSLADFAVPAKDEKK